MTKLNYDNAAALINAFKQGAKFKLIYSTGEPETVTAIEAAPVDISRNRHGLIVRGSGSGAWHNFRPDGSNVAGIRLARDESLGYERTSVTVGDSVFGWTPAKKAATMAVPAQAAPEPFLKRILAGEVFHCPATRETLVDVKFSKGSLQVTLQPAEGTILDRRVSENYDHEGKHKWVPARSLVAGPVPPKVVVKTYSSEDLWTTAPRGDYKAEGSYGIHVRVVTNGAARAVLFSPSGHGINALDLMSREAWVTERFAAIK